MIDLEYQLGCIFGETEGALPTSCFYRVGAQFVYRERLFPLPRKARSAKLLRLTAADLRQRARSLLGHAVCDAISPVSACRVMRGKIRLHVFGAHP